MMVMRRAYRYAFLGLLLVGLAALNWRVGHSQADESRFYAITGHSVSGDFLALYRAVPYPEFVHGYPITDAFINKEGIEVQYFNRARFERLPDGRVIRTALGSLLYSAGRQAAGTDENPATCRSFSTGYLVCMDFLTFFDAHGGLEQFGAPIARAERAGDRIVQYFEYARFEWIPELADPQLRTSLGDLGRQYFFEAGENMALLEDAGNSLSVIDITGLRAHAFPAATSARLGENLSLFVIVQNQTYKAVSGARIILLVESETGQAYRHEAVSNENGFAEIRLPILPAYFSEGKVTVRALASYDGLENDTLTSFQIVR